MLKDFLHVIWMFLLVTFVPRYIHTVVPIPNPISMLFLAIISIKFVDKDKLNVFGVSLSYSKRSVFFGILAFTFLCLSSLILVPFNILFSINLQTLKEIYPRNLLLASILLFLFNSIEEMIFRGYIINKLTKIGENAILTPIALFISGFLHAIWHLNKFLNFRFYFISISLGVISGIIFIISKRNILGPCLFHWLTNIFNNSVAILNSIFSYLF